MHCVLCGINKFYAGGRMDFARGKFKPKSASWSCKLYPANIVDCNWVIQVNSWFPKNGNQGSLYLYTMPWGFFLMHFHVTFITRACLEKSRGRFLNQTKHKQILNTKTIKLQPENQQDRACRIEFAHLGLNFPLIKSILPQALKNLQLYLYHSSDCGFNGRMHLEAMRRF